MASALLLSACGGSSSSSGQQNNNNTPNSQTPSQNNTSQNSDKPHKKSKTDTLTGFWKSECVQYANDNASSGHIYWEFKKEGKKLLHQQAILVSYNNTKCQGKPALIADVTDYEDKRKTFPDEKLKHITVKSNDEFISSDNDFGKAVYHRISKQQFNAIKQKINTK